MQIKEKYRITTFRNSQNKKWIYLDSNNNRIICNNKVQISFKITIPLEVKILKCNLCMSFLRSLK